MTISAEGGDCCTSKDVGGVQYILVGTLEKPMYNCIDNCLYETVGQFGTYCFAPGVLPVNCTEEDNFVETG